MLNVPQPGDRAILRVDVPTLIMTAPYTVGILAHISDHETSQGRGANRSGVTFRGENGVENRPSWSNSPRIEKPAVKRHQTSPLLLWPMTKRHRFCCGR